MNIAKRYFPILLITILYWIIALILWSHFGLKVVNDSARYLEYARRLSSGGFYFDPHNFWYLGYVVFIFLVGLISPSLQLLVFCQYLLSFMAILALYEAGRKLFNSKLTGLLSCFLMMLFIEPMMWNSYILPESFYLSILCIFFYTLISVLKNKGDKKFLIGMLVLLPITLLAKPTAIALVIAFALTTIYLVLKILKSTSLKVTLLLAIITSCLILANKMLTTYDVIDNYLLGEIIYGMSYYKSFPFHYLMTIQQNTDLYIPDHNLSPLHQISLFILHNPWYWLKLFCSKVFYLVTHVRPYWSVWHNLHAVSILIFSYGLIFKGLKNNFLNKKLTVFSLSYLAAHMLIIGLTSVDYDGRFLIPLLPIIFIMAAKVLADILHKNELTKRLLPNKLL